jgi:hypothetical protein
VADGRIPYMPVHPIRVRHCLVVAGVLVSTSLLVPQPANADVGIESVRPSAGVPGDAVEVTVACGFCFPPCSESPRAANATCMPARWARPPQKYSFPILLVPTKHRLAPHGCGPNALCAPTSVGVPSGRPFIRLGRALPAFGSGDIERTGAMPRYRLRFRIPAVKPGLYHLVIYSGPKDRQGALVADARRWQLWVRRPDPVTPARDDAPSATAWVGGGAAAVALVAMTLIYRRRARPHPRPQG